MPEITNYTPAEICKYVNILNVHIDKKFVGRKDGFYHFCNFYCKRKLNAYLSDGRKKRDQKFFDTSFIYWKREITCIALKFCFI